MLAEEGISYFFVDSHGLWYAENPPRYGVYRPVMTESGVFAFGRDPESSEQVWSGEIGYPGDFRYREFYRDVGFDREAEYIAPYIDRSGARVNTGIKYHRITGKNIDLGEKAYYNIEEAHEAAMTHACDFISKKITQVETLYSQFAGIQPIIVAPFDAELFGHWWFEGPKFIENLFRCLAKTDIIQPVTPKEFIDQSLSTVQITTPADSTWGANGYNEVWINGSNDWIYPHLDEMVERMTRLAKDFYNETEPLKVRALKQAMRELLLAQSSDWAFIMTTGTTVEYAALRTKQHITRFNQLYDAIYSGAIDETCLTQYEWIDGIFKDPDYRIYASR
jgi:1,4-alpha-glucan branching enzyme